MYDLAIIGLGSAGIEALNIALKNNLNVIVFEPNDFGGTCLNKGCIPTKSILHSANLYSKLKNSTDLGIYAENMSFSWPDILNRKNLIVSKFKKALELAYSKNVTVIKSHAQIEIKQDQISIIAENNKYIAKNTIIATGSKPFELSELKFDHKFVIDSYDILELDKLPKDIVIIGSGAIGLEWANILSCLDCNVTVVEKQNCLLPGADIDIQKRLDRILKLKNIKVYKNDFVVSKNSDKLYLNSGHELNTDLVLCAVGRKPVLPPCNCDILVNNDCTTNYNNLFVAGDATNNILLAHNAFHQAKCIMDKILFNKDFKNQLVPSVIYISPEIASIGIKEQDIENISDYKIVKIPIASLAKSWCDNETDGFIKVIFKNDLIKGAHIVSNNACELVSIFNILISQNITKSVISDIVFPHPSYSEIISEIVKNA